MSSGSYFTIYRKNSKVKASDEMLTALKNEYFLANKKDAFGQKLDDDAMKKDIPVLMHANFKADSICQDGCDIYYDADGYEHKKLLEFCFGSMFTGLKEHFELNTYKFSKSSTLISKAEAAKILQAVDYVLGEEYSKKFEDVLSNEYVRILGEGYSPFENRFKSVRKPFYIDKDCDSYVVSFSDHGIDSEIAECDDNIKFCLSRVRACLFAFLNAEECSYDGEELVLEYSAY